MACAGRLCLRQLLSACVHLSRAAGRIIRKTHEEGRLGAHNKNNEADQRDVTTMAGSEVLTVADLRAQHVIVTNLRAMFPGIQLVGEEDEENSKAEASRFGEIPVISLCDVPLLEGLQVPDELSESMTLQNTCLWIDPLDGTLEFIRGNLQNVCVLIGITVNGRPIGGVVLEPFLSENSITGVATYGAVGSGVRSDRALAQTNSPEPDTFLVGLDPKSAEEPRIKQGLLRLQNVGAAEMTISHGSGQNLLKVLRGETSVHLHRGASRWDICAGEGLLVAAGGRLTDLDGRPYEYVQGMTSYKNTRGVIATAATELHSKVLKATFVTQRPEEDAAIHEPVGKRARRR